MSESVVTRPAELADLKVIAEGTIAMAKESEELVLNQQTVLEATEAVLRDPAKGTYYLIEVSGKVVGQLMITYEWSDWRNANMWWIQSVYVVDELRKRGLFRKLYDYVKQKAISAGAGGLRLYVDKANSRAQATYAALGMVSHYEVYEEEFMPAQSSA